MRSRRIGNDGSADAPGDGDGDANGDGDSEGDGSGCGDGAGVDGAGTGGRGGGGGGGGGSVCAVLASGTLPAPSARSAASSSVVFRIVTRVLCVGVQTDPSRRG